MPGKGFSSSTSRRTSSASHATTNGPLSYTTGTARAPAGSPVSPLVRTFFGSLTAIASAVTLVYIPLSATSSRFKADQQAAAAGAGRPAPSMSSAARAIWRAEGMRGFFKGGSAPALKVAQLALVTAAAFFLTTPSTSDGEAQRKRG